MSSAQTPNSLTNEQDKICRDFYREVVANEALWGQNTKTQGIVANAVLNVLGYTVSAGIIVPIGTVLKFRYGDSPDSSEFVGLFDRDAAIVEGVLDDDTEVTADADDSDEAGPSESPEGDEVGDVLLEDV